MSKRGEKGFTDIEMGPLLGQANPGASDSSLKSKSTDLSVPTASGSTKKGKPVVAETTNNASGVVLTSCLMYSSCSVGMVLVNKSLASSYNHLIQGDLNILLVVFQAITAVLCVEFSKKMRWVDYPSFSMQTAKQWAPVNIMFCTMLFTGMASLQHNNVPMVTVFKNVTNIFVTAGDYYFFGTKVDKMVTLAFGIMLLGAIMAARNDLYITFIGIFWMIANCISTAGYILYMKFATKNVKLSKFGMVYYNNVLCTLFLLPASLLMGEVKIFFDTQAIHTFDYFFKNFCAGFVGFFLNFASLNCVQHTGPTTYAIIGSLNKIPITLLGWLIFDAVINGQTWFYISVSMMGGFIYSYAKLQAGKKKQVSS